MNTLMTDLQVKNSLTLRIFQRAKIFETLKDISMKVEFEDLGKTTGLEF